MLTNLVLTLQVSATTCCRMQKFTAVNAAGDVTPPFLAINGLNVREMPKLADGDDGTVVGAQLPLDGLGCAQDPKPAAP